MTRKKSRQQEIHTLNINDKVIRYQQITPNSFNEYFSSVAEIVFNDVH